MTPTNLRPDPGTTVVVLGAGGHARVCIDILRETGDVTVAGCVNLTGVADVELDVPILGRQDELDALVARGFTHVFPAIGANRARLAALARARAAGATVVNAVSTHAVLAPSVRVGAGVAVMPGAVVNGATVLGDAVIVNTNASVDHDCRLGDGVHVAPGCAVAGGVTLDEGVFLGIGSCVIPGRRVGAWATVGAGGVVVHDVPAGVTAIGAPARSRGVGNPHH